MSFAVEGSDATSDDSPRSGDEAPSWSKLAVATFALSLLSPLAVVSIVFIPIVILTLVFAVAAVALATYNGRAVKGGVLASVAIFLTLFCLSVSISRYSSYQRHLSSEARAFAEHWFELIKEGKQNEAHQLSMAGEFREPPEIPIPDAYELNSQARSNRDSFYLQPPIKFLANDPKNTTVRFVSVVGRDTDEKTDSVKMRFTMRYQDITMPRETNFTIMVTRERKPRFEEHRWYFRGITDVQTQ